MRADADSYFMWSVSGDGDGDQAAYAVAVDEYSNVFVGGGFGASSPSMLRGYSDWGVPLGSVDYSGSGSMVVRSIVYVAPDKLYVAGEYSGPVTLPGTGASGPFPSSIGDGLFVCRIFIVGSVQPSLVVENVQYFPRTGEKAAVRAICVRSDGGLYVAGSLKGTLQIGNNSVPPQLSLQNGGVFVLGLDPSLTTANLILKGNVSGSGSDCSLADVVLGPDGSLYIAGDLIGTMNLSGSGPQVPISSVGTATSRRIYVARLQTNNDALDGSVIDQGQSADNAVAADLQMLPDGALYLCGTFTGTIGVNDTAGPIASAGGSDIFLGKLRTDALGKFSWLVRGGGTENDSAHALAAEGSATLYMIGSAGKDFTMGSKGTGIAGVLHASVHGGNRDFVVGCYGADGLLQRVKLGGYDGDDWGYALALGPYQNMAVAGAAMPGTQFRSAVGGAQTELFAALLPTQSDVDVLPDDGDGVEVGHNVYQVTAVIENRGTSRVRNVPVRIEIYRGNVLIGSQTVVAFPDSAGRFETWPIASDTFNLPLEDSLGLYTAVIRTEYPPDEDSRNDTIRVAFGPQGGLGHGGNGDDGMLEEGDSLRLRNGRKGIGGTIYTGAAQGIAVEVGLGRLLNNSGTGLRFDARGYVCGAPNQQVALLRADVDGCGIMLSADFSCRAGFNRIVELWNAGTLSARDTTAGPIDAVIENACGAGNARVEICAGCNGGIIWKMERPTLIRLPWNGETAIADEVHITPLEAVTPADTLRSCSIEVLGAGSASIGRQEIRHFDLFHAVGSDSLSADGRRREGRLDALLCAHDGVLEVTGAPSSRSKGVITTLGCASAFTTRLRPLDLAGPGRELSAGAFGRIGAGSNVLVGNLTVRSDSAGLEMIVEMPPFADKLMRVQAFVDSVPNGSVMLPMGYVGGIGEPESVIAVGVDVRSGTPRFSVVFGGRIFLRIKGDVGLIGDSLVIEPVADPNAMTLTEFMLFGKGLSAFAITGEDIVHMDCGGFLGAPAVSAWETMPGIIVTPNPAVDMLHIHARPRPSERARIALADAYGQEVAVVYDALHSSGDIDLHHDIRGIPSGMYYLCLRSGRTEQRVPVVIIR